MGVEETMHLPLCFEQAENIGQLIDCLDYAVKKLKQVESQGWEYAGSNECYSVLLVKPEPVCGCPSSLLAKGKCKC